ncbi:MFS transporter [uncultured Sphingomonas sp.]|uniref:MFS transporter n=1 Tax=uncultured Sphingomonas sp. TaxID=158754 RepID=UPI0035CA6629
MTKPRFSWQFLAFVFAVAVGNAVAHLCTSAMPLQVGSLIDGFGLTATAAGVFGFFQVGTLALGMIFFAPLSHRYRPFVVCLTGLLIAAASNAALYFSPASLPLLCLLGLISGFGYCLMLSATVGAPAASAQADKVYAASSSGGLLLLVALLSLLPLANSYFGVRGIFLGIAILLVVSIPLLWGFRYTPATAAPAAAAAARVDAVSGRSLKSGTSLLIIWVLYSLGTGAMWTFAERIGHALHIPGPTIGFILSISVFMALVGSGLAALLSDRLDRATAIGIGLVGGGATCLMLALSTGLWMYALACVLYWIVTIFFYVLMLGTAAAIDPTGRLATLGTGCERLAFAFGAPIGGMFVDMGSFLWIGLLALTSCSILAPLCLPALSRAVKRAHADRHIDAVPVPLV